MIDCAMTITNNSIQGPTAKLTTHTSHFIERDKIKTSNASTAPAMNVNSASTLLTPSNASAVKPQMSPPTITPSTGAMIIAPNARGKFRANKIAMIAQTKTTASPPSAGGDRRFVDGDLELVSVEQELVTLAQDPTTLHSARTRRAALAVGHDEETVPLPAVLCVVHDVRGRIEVGATRPGALALRRSALAPLVDVFLIGAAVEREDVDGHSPSQHCQLGEERRELSIVDRTRLIHRDQEPRRVTTLHTRVDVRVLAVDALDRRGAFAADQVSDELLEDGAPVDDTAHAASDFSLDVCRDASPPV